MWAILEKMGAWCIISTKNIPLLILSYGLNWDVNMNCHKKKQKQKRYMEEVYLLYKLRGEVLALFLKMLHQISYSYILPPHP
jgi:hypothetical protein